jgi:hypothetical protein
VIASSSTFPSRTVGWLITTRPCPALKVRAASTSLPTLFPSPVASRPPPSSSHQEPSMKWLRPVDHVRYVDPQRRYTAVLGPSWNVLFRALPHDDRAGTHDSADGRCDRMPPLGAVKPPALWISLKNLWGARCSAGFLAGLGRNRNFTAPQHARPQHSRNAVWLFSAAFCAAVASP